MRTIIYGEQRIDVKILSLKRPRARARLALPSNGVPAAHVTLLSPVEIPLGACFSIANGSERPFQASTLGCVKNPSGQFVVLGSIQT